LKRIFELTGGKSLVANIALVENNAKVASQIAVALASFANPPKVMRA
jgi:pseudouridine-5'-phosphate glycosidase